MVERIEQTTVPWEAQAGHLIPIWEQAARLAQTPMRYFPGQTFAGFSPQQQQALGMTEQRAMGSPYEAAGRSFLTGALSQPQVNLTPGVYGAQQAIQGLGTGQQTLGGAAGGLGAGQRALGGFASGQGMNPYLDAQFQAASRGLGTQFRENVLPGIASQFGASGRTGSGAHQQALGQAQQQYGQSVGDLAANIYGRGYEAERGRQLTAAQALQQGGLQAGQALQAGGLQGIGQLGNLYGQVGAQQLGAAGLLPSMQALDYANIDRLYGAGQRVQDLQNLSIQDQINRFNFAQQQPWQQLAQYSGLVQGRPWGGMTSSTMPGVPLGQQLVGTGLAIGGEIARNQ